MNNLPLILGALGPIFALILLGLGLRRLGFPGDGFWPAAERFTYLSAVSGAAGAPAGAGAAGSNTQSGRWRRSSSSCCWG
jgi:hypothetical protein